MEGGDPVEPIRTDFTGYEGKFVAIDIRTGVIVMADDDHHRLCDRMIAEKINRTAGITRVPAKGELRVRIG